MYGSSGSYGSPPGKRVRVTFHLVRIMIYAPKELTRICQELIRPTCESLTEGTEPLCTVHTRKNTSGIQKNRTPQNTTLKGSTSHDSVRETNRYKTFRAMESCLFCVTFLTVLVQELPHLSIGQCSVGLLFAFGHLKRRLEDSASFLRCPFSLPSSPNLM